jgi:hypothetical protein
LTRVPSVSSLRAVPSAAALSSGGVSAVVKYALACAQVSEWITQALCERNMRCVLVFAVGLPQDRRI